MRSMFAILAVFLFSFTSFANDFENVAKGPSFEAELSDVRECVIAFVIVGNRFHNSRNNANNHCYQVHQFFNTRDRCFVRQHSNSRYETDFRYEQFFNGRGDDWSSSRRNAYNNFFNYLERTRFDRQQFSGTISFNALCDN